ncbi:ABC transporter ATP-binding protein [Anaerocellum danielii]|uniref:ABC transporter ATP-binding protein n=1 Tax=Anaerocellum danielii TaxID=1387557 RepID=A0ABZ0U063_9FIRM|nr:ABC transporter ATP-binding protein [Caldicellulosiruptor danielii]WPX09099.1 ABC transporter ATP-binding protein [Caldicellulosiruptor danielii]
MLKVDNLEFSFKDFQVLSGICFEARRGSIVSILGNNGAGKSTLLKCIARLLKPKSGAILIDGKDANSFSLRQLSKNVAYVPQRYTANRVTVYETILLGRKPHFTGLVPSSEDLEKVEMALDLFELKHLAFRYLDEISGGELQKVVIARAFVQDPKVLLLDEPINNLDLKNQIEVLKILKMLSKQKGILVVVILHDLNLAIRFSDWFVFVKDGRIFASGSKEVITAEVISRVYGIDVKVEKHGNEIFVVPEVSAI